MNPVMLIRSWTGLLQDLAIDDLKGFPNEETSKSEILDMMSSVKGFENTEKW
jgi:hypothetical protein